MLRTFLLIGIIVILVSAVVGAALGLATVLLWYAFKVALLGAVVYFLIRIISPSTAHRLRAKFEGQSLPRL